MANTYVDTFTLNEGKVQVTRTYNHLTYNHYPQIHGVLISDSRARDFGEFLPLDAVYNIHHVVYRGARVPQLQFEAIRELKTIPKSDATILYICGGGNELTFKEFHDGGMELAVHTKNNVLENLLNFKSKVRRWFPNTLVGFSTIPVINFKKTKAYYKDVGS